MRPPPDVDDSAAMPGDNDGGSQGRVRMQAKNRCCRCRHEWVDRPMGFARHPACPSCGSAYWEWLNYGGGGTGSGRAPGRVNLLRAADEPEGQPASGTGKSANR